MPERRSVRWSPAALRDIERLSAYLIEESPLRADVLMERIIARAESLEAQPFRGRTVPELRGIADDSWRELLESRWRILYQVETSGPVMIHGVFDGRRDLQDVLWERMLEP